MKRGSYKGSQRWYCKTCGCTFTHRKEKASKSEVLSIYSAGKMGTRDVAERLRVSERTIVRRLKDVELVMNPLDNFTLGQEVAVMMDATYWGRNFGVVVLKDYLTRRILWFKFIEKKETLSDYEEGINAVEDAGLVILGIISDGLKGLRNKFMAYRFQLCQFHSVQYVRIKLTNNPKTEAARELLAIANQMCSMDKESFTGLFNQWQEKWSDFLKEKSQDDNGKSSYKHQRLRSAWSSIKRNMDVLWTFYDHPETRLPNTNNALEGFNSSLKDKLRRHRGISQQRRKFLITSIINAHNPLKSKH